MQIGQQPYPYSGKAIEGGGKISVGTTAVEVTFTLEPRTIVISADSANTGTLYVGGSGVTSAGANAITYLSAGDTITLDYNDTTEALYVVASAASQNFWKGAIK
jgi:translation elongation factor EF-4